VRQTRSSAFQTDPSGPPEFQARIPGDPAADVLAEQLTAGVIATSALTQSKPTTLAVGADLGDGSGEADPAAGLGHGTLGADEPPAAPSASQEGHVAGIGGRWASHAATASISVVERSKAREDCDMGGVETVPKDKPGVPRLAALPQPLEA
jgi:hypothetical protein